MLLLWVPGCSHDSELDQIEANRRLPVGSPKDPRDSGPSSDILRAACALAAPTAGFLGSADDIDPAPGLQVQIEVETDKNGAASEVVLLIDDDSATKQTSRAKLNDGQYLATFDVTLPEGLRKVTAICGADERSSVDREWTVDLIPCEIEIQEPLAASVFFDTDDADKAKSGLQITLVGQAIGPDCETLRWGVCADGDIIADSRSTTLETNEGVAAFSISLTLVDAGSVTVCAEVADRAGNTAKRSLVLEHRVCGADEALCKRECWDDTASNPEHCGIDCAECPNDVPNGDPKCVLGMCGTQCRATFHLEGGACIPRSGCDGLDTACSGQDCCDRLTVTGADDRVLLQWGYDASNDGTAFPASPSNPSEWVGLDASKNFSVDGFWMDRTEVPVMRYRAFVEDYDDWTSLGVQPRNGYAGNPAAPAVSGWNGAWQLANLPAAFTIGSPPAGYQIGDQITVVPNNAADLRTRLLGCKESTWTDLPGGNETRPINCVNFYEAFLFCMWDNSRLPTEAEWFAAASGGGEQRAFPWSTPAGDITATDDSYAFYGMGDGTLPDLVGSRPKGASRLWGGDRGFLDLGGNVWEWVRDTATDSDPLIAIGTYLSDSSNPLSLAGDDDPVVRHWMRGGSTRTNANRLRTVTRELRGAWFRIADVGFRCAGPTINL